MEQGWSEFSEEKKEHIHEEEEGTWHPDCVPSIIASGALSERKLKMGLLLHKDSSAYIMH